MDMGGFRSGLFRMMSVTGRPIHWFSGFFDALDPRKSMKRAAMAAATGTLCYGAVKMSNACAWIIANGKHLDQWDVIALSALIVPLAALAGAVYVFKKDGTFEVGGDPSQPGDEPKEKP
jgi:hypothetical protein